MVRLSAVLARVYNDDEVMSCHDVRESCQANSGKRRIGIYPFLLPLWDSVLAACVIHSARFLVMQRLIACGHRFFWRTSTMPVIIPWSLGHQKSLSGVPLQEYVHGAIAEKS